MAKRNSAERRRTTIYFPTDLARKLAVFCASTDAEMSEVVSEALSAQLQKQDGSAPASGPRNALVKLAKPPVAAKEEEENMATKTKQTQLRLAADKNAEPETERELIMEIIDVTPEMAKEFLRNNFHLNRAIRRSAVDRYVEDMKSGAWKVTHQGLAFDQNGTLIDGQHRCQAGAESGVTFRTTVFHYGNMPQVPMSAFDLGGARGAGNILEIEGLCQRGRGNSAAAIATALWRGVNNVRYRAEKASIRAVYLHHKLGIDWVDGATAGYRLAAPIAAAFAYAYPCAREDVASLYAQVLSGANLPEKSPALAINKFVAEVKAKGRNRKDLTDADIFAKTLSGIEKHLTSETSQRLRITPKKNRAGEDVVGPAKILNEFAKRREAIGLDAIACPKEA